MLCAGVSPKPVPGRELAWDPGDWTLGNVEGFGVVTPRGPETRGRERPFAEDAPWSAGISCPDKYRFDGG